MIIKNREIKTVVSDFDGTIIRLGELYPPKEFYGVVNDLLEKGYFFIAASGRQYANLRRMLSPIEQEIAYITENGCLVMYQDKIVHKEVIEENLVQQLILEFDNQETAEFLISGVDTSYVVPKNSIYADKLEFEVKNNVTRLKSFQEIKGDILKISFYFSNGIPKEVEAYFHEKYDAQLEIVDAGNGWLDCNPKGSGKGPALRKLAEQLNLNLEEMVAFGDSENDISMLNTVGVSFAMSHAKPHVKAAADFECVQVEEVILSALM